MPRSHSNRKVWWMLLTIVILFGAAWLLFPKQRIAQLQYEQQKPTDLPTETPLTLVENATPSNGDTSEVSEGSDSCEVEKDCGQITGQAPVEPPTELNLDVPFTSQAPLGIWDEHTKEYCEEASVLMVARYFDGRGIASPDDALTALLELEAWQNDHFGYFKSTTAAETASMIEDVYGLTATVQPLQRIDGMKVELADGALVILPAAGQELGNPYFQRPGPVYHMLVVKGYTDDGKIITNDPGTKRGADFVYDADTLFNAVGDYNNNDPSNGAKVMIVVKKS